MKTTKTMADPEAVRAVTKAIIAAKRPLFHAGLGVLYAEAWDELAGLGRIASDPGHDNAAGQKLFSRKSSPLRGVRGTIRTSSRGPDTWPNATLSSASGSSLSTSIFAAPIPAGKVAVQLTVDERDLNKDYPLDYP